MKKNCIVILVLVALLVPSCASLKEAKENDYGELEKKFEVSLTKDEIFNKLIRYFNSQYVSAKVIDYSDKELGIININAHFEHHPPAASYQLFYLYFKLQISIIDNKFKLKITPLRAIYTYNMSKHYMTADMAKSFTNDFNKLAYEINLYVNSKTVTDF